MAGLLSKGAGKGLAASMSAKPAQASSEEEGPGMEMAAANGMLEAIKAGDASALSAALKEHYAACKMAEGSEEAGEAYE